MMESETNPAGTPPVRILVVDDEESIRRLFVRLFSETGKFQVTVAVSGADALQQLETKEFSILVSDERMPGMRGIELLARAEERWPDMIRILMTGFADLEATRKAINVGRVFAFISKPFRDEELFAQLERAATLVRRRSSPPPVATPTEQSLLPGEDRFSGLFNEIHDCVYIATMGGQFLDINPAGVELFGFSGREELLATFRAQDAYQNVADRTHFLEEISRRGYVKDYKLALKNRHGMKLDILATVNCIRDAGGAITSYRGILRDVTQSRQVERTMQDLLDFQKSLLNAIPVPVFFSDINGHFLGMNQGIESLFGRPIDELIDKTVFDVFPVEIAEILYAHDCELYRRPGVRSDETLIHDAQGTERHVVLHKATFSDGSGHVQGLICAILDITERKRREVDLQRKNEQLEVTLDQLRATQARLVQQEKLASIGSLAAGVAHELNNPIGFISSNFSILRQYLATISGYIALGESQSQSDAEKVYKQEKKIEFILHDIPELLNESREGIERITSIVQNLRQFSRVDYESKFDPYDINQGLENTLVVARNEIKYVADVVKEFGDIPAVECVAGEINQVFLNILINAAQAIADQKRKEKGRIVVRTRVDGAWLICEIEDDGPGIPADVIGRVFDPFFTTKEAGRGTGLGLNISYDIVVNKHGGELTVSSNLGRGTRFTVKLPVSQNRNTEEENDGG
jgi:two-component system, NtrC family, sensor kinase